jgi:uncharacterized iron-regulated membrane protein
MIRNIALHTHKVIGITIAFMMIAIALTGSYLVWDKEINPHIRNYIHQVEVLDNVSNNSLEKITNLIANNHPNSRLEKIILPLNINDPYLVPVISPEGIKQDFYIDIYQEKILKIYSTDNYLKELLSKIHTELLAGNIGKILLGLSSIGLLILTVTGLYLWKGWKKITLGFNVRWSSKLRFLNYDLHQVTGIFSLILVANIALTGAVLALDKPLRDIFIKTPLAIQENSISSSNIKESNSSLDSMLDNAKNSLTSGRITEIKFPQRQNIVEFRYKLPYEITPLGKNFIRFNKINGEVLDTKNINEETAFKRFKTWCDALHYGTFWGLTTMIIYLLLGVILASLSLTGFLIWVWKISNFQSPSKRVIKKASISKVA